MYATMVRRAAAWLDDEDPDWYNHVDLDRLNLANGQDCILGQLAGRLVPGASHFRSVFRHYYWRSRRFRSFRRAFFCRYLHEPFWRSEITFRRVIDQAMTVEPEPERHLARV